MVKPLCLGEANIMATLGRKALGPFGSAREAYKAAEESELKLGITVEVLEVFMARERKIRKGQRRDEMPHFCLYEATISSTALADITGTVAPIACAAQVTSRPPIGAVEATATPAPVAARASASRSARAGQHACSTAAAGENVGRPPPLGKGGVARCAAQREQNCASWLLFWGLQHYREWALRGTPGACRGPPAAPRRATAST
jgi:hypothetical protein